MSTARLLLSITCERSVIHKHIFQHVYAAVMRSSHGSEWTFSNRYTVMWKTRFSQDSANLWKINYAVWFNLSSNNLKQLLSVWLCLSHQRHFVQSSLDHLTFDSRTVWLTEELMADSVPARCSGSCGCKASSNHHPSTKYAWQLVRGVCADKLWLDLARCGAVHYCPTCPLQSVQRPMWQKFYGLFQSKFANLSRAAIFSLLSSLQTHSFILFVIVLS